MIRFILGIFVSAVAASSVEYQFIAAAVGLGLMIWGFYAMYTQGELNEH